jgi:hypothetical protein
MKARDWISMVASALIVIGIFMWFLSHARECELAGGMYVRPWNGGWYRCIR